jgi:folate-binding protein YgfZ
MGTSTTADAAACVPHTGADMPARFAGVEQECAAVRRRCGVLDAGCRALLRMTGADRLSFLQGMLSNDVARLHDGEGTYAALLTQQGKVVSDLRLYVLAEEVWLDVPVRLVAASHTGERGYLLLGSPGSGAVLWARCCAAGAEPVGYEALDVLRIEAGIPWHGRDMDETTLIGEVGLEAAISYRKGCYLGQEIVERVSARGQVQRKLVGLLCAGRTPPPAGAVLTHDGKEVGWLTSSTWSPTRNAVVALGYVRREHWDNGTAVQVQLPAGTIDAAVAVLPFYAGGSETPRDES